MKLVALALLLTSSGLVLYAIHWASQIPESLGRVKSRGKR